MCRRLIALILVISSCGWDLVTPGIAGAAVPPAQAAPAAVLTGRIVAVAIPGAAGLSLVGTFLAGLFTTTRHWLPTPSPTASWILPVSSS